MLLIYRPELCATSYCLSAMIERLNRIRSTLLYLTPLCFCAAKYKEDECKVYRFCCVACTCKAPSLPALIVAILSTRCYEQINTTRFSTCPDTIRQARHLQVRWGWCACTSRHARHARRVGHVTEAGVKSWLSLPRSGKCSPGIAVAE